MYVIAVTGGMGSGKSLACEYFLSRGAIVIDLDDIARRVIDPGGPAYERLVEHFGDDIIAPDGQIDRGALALLAFSNDAETGVLNRIVHPVVLREIVEGITNLRLMERPPQVVVLEIPLLAEAPVFADVADTVLAIEAPSDLRLRRLVDAGADPLDVSRRIARQATDEERAALAEHVIPNAGTTGEFIERLERYWDEVAPRGL